MARIRERPSKAGGPPSYRVEWRRGGRGGKDQSCTMPTEKLAVAAKSLAESRGHLVADVEVYRAVLGLDDATEPARPAAPTLAEWTKTWITERRELGDVQDDTLAEYLRVIVRWVLPQLGYLPLTAITEDTVRDWVAWLNKQISRRGRALSANTVHRTHTILHGLLAGAVPKWLAANPASRPPGGRRRSGLPKIRPHQAVFLTRAEVARILACCDPRIRDMVLVAVGTGLRLGELLVLRVQDIDLAGRRKVVRVRRALKSDGTIGDPKSRRSRRDVPVSKGVAAVLARLVDGRRRDQLVFPAPRGGVWRPSNLRQRHWLPALGAARRCPDHPPAAPAKKGRGPARKLRPDEVSTCSCPGRLHQVPRWHDLRHTYVSGCVAAGMDIMTVSRRVGHDSAAFTMDIYGHLWATETDDRLDEFDRLMMIAEDEAA